jgi:hypothetical protein
MFQTFQEGKISFQPTYRRDRLTSSYSNKKGQSPSWTDRIFHRSASGEGIQLLSYRSHEEVFGSDHRMVQADYRVKVEMPFVLQELKEW